MYSICVVGMTGEGKSSFVRDYIKSRNVCLFDVQNEYPELSTDKNNPRYRNTSCDVDNFIQDCKRRSNSVCVFEEATIFFQGSTDTDLRHLIVSKRHSRNVYIFLFHSISSVPPRLMQLTDYVVLMKTNDEPYQVEKKYPRLYGSYLTLSRMPKYSREIIKVI